KIHHSKAAGCDVAAKLSCLRPRSCVDSDPGCAVDLDLGLPLSLIVEEVGLVGGEFQKLEMAIEQEQDLIGDGEFQKFERAIE
ncbi:hypothetical protein Dimus_005554, partial [Dionaea muscipula]